MARTTATAPQRTAGCFSRSVHAGPVAVTEIGGGSIGGAAGHCVGGVGGNCGEGGGPGCVTYGGPSGGIAGGGADGGNGPPNGGRGSSLMGSTMRPRPVGRWDAVATDSVVPLARDGRASPLSVRRRERSRSRSRTCAGSPSRAGGGACRPPADRRRVGVRPCRDGRSR